MLLALALRHGQEGRPPAPRPTRRGRGRRSPCFRLFGGARALLGLLLVAAGGTHCVLIGDNESDGATSDGEHEARPDAEAVNALAGSWVGEGPDGLVTLALCEDPARNDVDLDGKVALVASLALPDGRRGAMNGESGSVWSTPAGPEGNPSYRIALRAGDDDSSAYLRLEATCARSGTCERGLLTLGGSYALGWGAGDGAPDGGESGGAGGNAGGAGNSGAAGTASAPFTGRVLWTNLAFRRTSASADCASH